MPEEYVPEVNQRLALYKRLAGATGDAERGRSPRRAGRTASVRCPRAAEQLLDIVAHPHAPRAPLGVEKVEAGEGKALVTFAPATPIDPDGWSRAIQASRGRLRMKREFTLEATIAARRLAASA